MKKKTLGVDVGGVIIASTKEDQDTFFHGNHLLTPVFPGAFEGLRKLVDEVFGPQNVYVVSKCKPNVQQKTKEWLDHHDFYARTGIRRENVHFCLEKKDKGPICRDLQLTTFIDDRLEVLGYAYDSGLRDLYLLNPDPVEVAKFPHRLPYVQLVSDWQEVVAGIMNGQPVK